jgi:site-specific recombinase XerD
MTPKNSIHKYDYKLNQVLENVKTSSMSQRNKDLILGFDRVNFLEAKSKSRRLRVAGYLKSLALNVVKKDFDKLTIEDMRSLILSLSDKGYTAETMGTYKAILKKFYKWIEYGDEYANESNYPKIVAWFKTHVAKKDKHNIKASDLLTEEEVMRLVQAAEHPRDKAFIALLYELGCRISEIGNLTIGDFTKNKEGGFLVDISGKTGHRTPLALMSTQYILNWTNQHPDKNNSDAPFWTKRNSKEKLMYQSLSKIVKDSVKKAGIQKKVYNHLFRHSRATFVLANGIMNELQAKKYFGWTPDSKMLATYAHLVSQDANNALLEAAGIKPQNTGNTLLKPKHCPTCSHINPPEHRFCSNCSNILDVQTAVELTEKREAGDGVLKDLLKDDDVMRMLVKRANERGLLDKLASLRN